MKSLIEQSVRRPVATSMLFGMLFIFGFISFFQLPVELYPGRVSHHITVIIPVRGNWPPDQIEKEVVIPVEEALFILPGLIQLESYSQAGKATLLLTFSKQTSTEWALVEAREKLYDVLSGLSKEVEKPVIAQFRQSERPVFILSLMAGKQAPEKIKEWAERNIKDEFLRIPGIGNVDLIGGRDKKYFVDLNSERLNAFNLSMEEVLRSIQKSNVSFVVGMIKGKDKIFLVRQRGSLSELKDLENLVVAGGPKNAGVSLKQLGNIREGYLPQYTLSRFQFQNAVTLIAYKKSSANTLEACRNIREYLKKIKPANGSQWIVAYDRSASIEKSIKKLIKAVCVGIGSVCLLFFCFFKSWKGVLICCTGILCNLFISFFVFRLLGVSLNMMSLSGLLLGIGLITGGFVFVFDQAAKEFERTGKRVQSVVNGAEKTAAPLWIYAFSAAVVFIPLFCLEAGLKEQFQDLAASMVLIIFVSVFISIFLLPSWLAASGTKVCIPNRPGIVIHALYRKTLNGCLLNKYILPSLLLIAFVISTVLFAFTEKNTLIFNGKNDFLIKIEMPAGCKIEKTNRVAEAIESVLKEEPQCKLVSTQIQGWSAKIWISLALKRKSSASRFAAKLRSKIKEIGVKEKAFCYLLELNHHLAKEIRFEIQGMNLTDLRDSAAKVGRVLAQNNFFHEVKVRYKPGRPELHLRLKPDRLAFAGWTPSEFSMLMQAQLDGVIPTCFYTGQRETEVVVRLQEENRNNFKQISSMILVSPNGVPVALRDMVDFKIESGPSGIFRKNKMPVLEVSAGYSGLGFKQQIARAQDEISRLRKPKNVTIELGEEHKNQNRKIKKLTLAVILSCFVLYLFSAAFLESFFKSLLIMICVLSSFTIAVPLLYFSGEPVSEGVYFGLILLSGLTVKNGVFILRKIEARIRSEKLFRFAVKKGGAESLLPVLISSLATIAGFLSLAVCAGSLESFWFSLSLTMIGGVSGSTLVALFVIPLLIHLCEEFKRKRLKACAKDETFSLLESEKITQG